MFFSMCRTFEYSSVRILYDYFKKKYTYTHVVMIYEIHVICQNTYGVIIYDVMYVFLHTACGNVLLEPMLAGL